MLLVAKHAQYPVMWRMMDGKMDAWDALAHPFDSDGGDGPNERRRESREAL